MTSFSNPRLLVWASPALIAVCAALACSSEPRDRDNDSHPDVGTADELDGGSTDAGDGSTDGGTLPDPPDPAYWGLADKNCFRYDDGSKNDAFTLAVQEDLTTVAGVTTYHLFFRRNGFPQRDEWLEVKGDSLVLWRRTLGGDPFATPPTQATYVIFSPAPVYFEKEMRLAVPTTSKTNAKISSGGKNEQVATTVTFMKVSDETVAPLSEPQSTSKLTLSVTRDGDGSGVVDRFWFVPNLGLAQYELDGMEAPVTLTKFERNMEQLSCTP